MHPWAFRARFQRTAVGWKGSKLEIERIHEAPYEAILLHDASIRERGVIHDSFGEAQNAALDPRA